MTDPANALNNYYTATADGYDYQHVSDGDEHQVALEYMIGIFTTLRVLSVLDVGCGTGRGVRFLLTRRPDLRVVGVEPVAALRAQGEASGLGEYVEGSGQALPFPDNSFDAVIATGVMHHVPDADVVVREMQRVARRAVLISDTNRFGSGGRAKRLVKAAAFRTGLGRQFTRATTHGRGYVELVGDGLHYPYSIYDQVALLADWADRLFIIPTKDTTPRGWLGPLLTNSHGLLVAAKDPDDPGWASSANQSQPGPGD